MKDTDATTKTNIDPEATGVGRRTRPNHTPRSLEIMRFQVDVTLDQPSCPIHSLSAVRLHIANFYSRHFLSADQWITDAVGLSLI